MPDVYLPEDHSQAELDVAAKLALTLRCESLIVCWTGRRDERAAPSSDSECA